ncbi:uncharacterized protein LOC143614687 [Bidens hawaiensis]|uniref:uncharacterized protein LOC143614687 n=1 Tax=Bidens hawaiensis TaxID=980011 RepID=UPI00404B21FF
MNLRSLNIRGVGDVVKTRWVRKLVSNYNIPFLSIQDTQLVDGNSIHVDAFWGSPDFDSVMENAKGSELVNVHGPRDSGVRRIIWSELAVLKNSRSDVWILMGDFNAVRFPEARLNSIFNPSCARAFNDFVVNAYLYEFPMKGQRFTFCKSRGQKFSKIDIFFMNQDFVDKWSNSSFTALPRHLLDHSPIILISNPLDYGPCPFRLFNSWMEKSDFEKVVVDECSSFRFVGDPVGS